MDWSRGKGKKELFWGIGIFEISLKERHSGSVKSPQFRLILAKGDDQDRCRSHKIANYRSLFLKYRIFRVFWRKWLDYKPEKLP